MEGKTNINIVCAECGFNDAKNFREIFKKKMTCNPETIHSKYVIQLNYKFKYRYYDSKDAPPNFAVSLHAPVLIICGRGY